MAGPHAHLCGCFPVRTRGRAAELEERAVSTVLPSAGGAPDAAARDSSRGGRCARTRHLERLVRRLSLLVISMGLMDAASDSLFQVSEGLERERDDVNFG